MKNHRSFNVFGNLALVNFPDDYSVKDKKNFAVGLLIKHKSIKTVLEKSGNFHGRLRKQNTKWLAGEKTKEVLYRENGCVFRFNIDETYFSTRLANERLEVCKFVRPDDKILAMFAGVAPFPIVIAKNRKVKKIYSNELGKKVNEYAKINIKKNKLVDKIELVPGDIKKVAPKLRASGEKFDLILMTRPNLDETFLNEAFMLSKNRTRIYYHSFCRNEERGSQVEMIKKEAKKYNFCVKILNTKAIGDIAPGKIRFRILFQVISCKKNIFSRISNLLKKSR